MPKFLGYPFRLYMTINDKKRIKKLPHYTEGFETIDDIRYAPKCGKFHRFDLIIPEGKREKVTPAVIDIHGGAYFFGYKWINDDIARYFAIKSGWKVVNGNYRIVGFGTNLFDGVEDVVKLIEYIYANADHLKIDRNNIFLMGDSAGGHIMTLAAMCFYNKELREKLGIEVNENIKFRALSLTCPILSFDPYLKSKMFRPFIKDIVCRDLSETSERYKLSQAKDLFVVGSIPVIFNTAWGDFLKQQSLDMHAYLQEKGHDTKLIFYEEPIIEGRKLEHVYNVMFPFYEESVKTNDDIIEFFNEHKK